jgi:hypothetical protein
MNQLRVPFLLLFIFLLLEVPTVQAVVVLEGGVGIEQTNPLPAQVKRHNKKIRKGIERIKHQVARYVFPLAGNDDEQSARKWFWTGVICLGVGLILVNLISILGYYNVILIVLVVLGALLQLFGLASLIVWFVKII